MPPRPFPWWRLRAFDTWSLQRRAVLVALLSAVPLLVMLVADAVTHHQARRESLRWEMASVLQTAAQNQAQELVQVRTLLETAERIPGVVGAPAATCATVLPRILPAQHPYNTLSRTDASGRIDCASRPASIGLRVDSLASFQRPRRTGRFDIGDYQRARGSGTPVIVAALPVRDAHGTFQHMLAISLRLDSLLARLHLGGLPLGTRLELRDQSGTLLVERARATGPGAARYTAAGLPPLLDGPPTVRNGPRAFWEERRADGTWVLWTRIHADPERAGAWLAAHVPEAYLRAELVREAGWRLLVALTVVTLLGMLAWHSAERWVGREVAALTTLATLVREERSLPPTGTRLPELAPIEAQLRAMSELRREREQMHQQLRQTERLDSLGAVVGSVAHDFNNALGVMLAATEVAEQEVAPYSPAADQLATIRQTVERSAQITQQLLAFAKRTPGTQQTAPLDKVLEPLRDVLPRVLGKPHQLRWDIPAETIWVHLDGVELEQALMNLISNAREALAGQTGGHVTIRADVPRPSLASEVGLDPGTPWCTLTVEDTGCGIPDEQLGRICEPFFSTRQGQGGTGLGLPSVIGMVRRAGGDLRITSQVGRGSCFTLWLPRITADQVAHAERLRTAPPRALPLAPLHLWLADDEEALRQNLATRLEDAGYTVTPFGTADALLTHLENPQTPLPDIVVTDWQMPGGGGAAVMAAAEAVDLPWVVLSANPPTHLDPQRVLLKPVTSEQLRRRMADLVPSPRRDGSPVSPAR